MKKVALLLLLIATFKGDAMAQSDSSAAPAPAQTLLNPPAPSSQLSWKPILSPFGVNQSWQLGLDKSLTAGGCVQREVHDGQWLAGPCRDVLLLVKNVPATLLAPEHKEVRGHLGAAIMYNAERGNATYSLRAGANVGPLVKAGLNFMVNRLPYLESLSSLTAPKFLSYIGGITTVDYAVGYRPVHSKDVVGNLTHGPMVKMDLPLEDVYALLKLGL